MAVVVAPFERQGPSPRTGDEAARVPDAHERDGSASLEFRGTLNEPVKGQSAVPFGVHRAKDDNFGTKRPAVIGYIFSVRPDVHVYVQFQPHLFDHVFMMAMTGRVLHAHVVMTPPRYGSADVPSISFSNEPIE